MWKENGLKRLIAGGIFALILCFGCASVSSDEEKSEIQDAASSESESEGLPKEAPEVFKVKFDSSMGEFVAEFHKDWAPLGVQRMHDLVKSDFFKGARFFRVIDGFMAQFGIAGDPAVQRNWDNQPLDVEPVKGSNTRGMITFAMAGRPRQPNMTTNNRTTQLFINFGDNSNLDQMGFAPIGKVVEGMDVVDKIHAGYGDGPPRGRGPDQGMIKSKGNEYLKEKFENLDYIKEATVVE